MNRHAHPFRNIAAAAFVLIADGCIAIMTLSLNQLPQSAIAVGLLPFAGMITGVAIGHAEDAIAAWRRYGRSYDPMDGLGAPARYPYTDERATWARLYTPEGQQHEQQ